MNPFRSGAVPPPGEFAATRLSGDRRRLAAGRQASCTHGDGCWCSPRLALRRAYYLGSDPVATGLVPSLSRPGGNVTGVATRAAGLTGKRMQLLKELIPGLSRVGVLLAQNIANPATMRDAETAARALKLAVEFREVRTPDDIETQIAQLAQAEVGAINVQSSTMLASHGARLAKVIAKHRIPAVYGHERYVEAGGLISYSSSVNKAFMRAASYVDRILKGARPGELAIEQTSDLDLAVNLKTAKALGITIPQSILVRADRVIE